jgi:hypothetical protein
MQNELDLQVVHECNELAHELQQLLRACCIDGQPRRERHILAVTLMLLRPAERRSIAMHICLQDILAGLVLVSHSGLTAVADPHGEQHVELELPVDWAAPAVVHGDRLSEYISDAERRWAAALLVDVVSAAWSGDTDPVSGSSCSLMIKGLYPLLISRAAADCAPHASMCSVAEDLFSQPFLLEKKKLIIALLNALLWRCDRGVQAVISTLVLDDRVPDTEVMPAASQIVRLLCRSPTKILHVARSSFVLQVSMQPTNCLETLCHSLIPLLGAPRLADGEEDQELTEREGYIAPTRNVERLHLTLLMVLNALLQGGDASLARVAAVNKCLLGPLFGPLRSARSRSSAPVASAPDPDDGRPSTCGGGRGITPRHVEALSGLAALLHGATMCTAANALVTVWSVGCRGFLVLRVLAESSQTPEPVSPECLMARALCRRILTCLAALTRHSSELAFSLAAAAFGEFHGDDDASVAAAAISVVAHCSRRLRRAFVGFALERCVAVRASLAAVQAPLAAPENERRERNVMRVIVDVLGLVEADPELMAGGDGAERLIDAVAQLVVVVPQSCALAAALAMTLPLTLCCDDHSVNHDRLARAVENLRRQIMGAAAGGGTACQLATADAHLTQLRLNLSLASSSKETLTPVLGCRDAAGLCQQLETSLALRLVPPTAVAVMQLLDVLSPPTRDEGTICSLRPEVLLTVLRVLHDVDDTCVAVKAVRCAALIALRRLGPAASPTENIRIFSETVLTHSTHSPASPGLPPAPWLRRDRIGMYRLRLLDVLLCIADEDSGDCLTLRAIDDCCTRGLGLFGAIEAASVRAGAASSEAECAAALHLCGHLGLALYPRVLPSRVATLATDVFRLASSGLCRAAAASMLSHVVLGLRQRELLADLAGVELVPVMDVASHMTRYISSGSPDGSSHMHDEVVRQHGRDILKGLRAMGRDMLKPEAGIEEDSRPWASHGLNLWASHPHEITRMLK